MPSGPAFKVDEPNTLLIERLQGMDQEKSMKNGPRCTHHFQYIYEKYRVAVDDTATLISSEILRQRWTRIGLRGVLAAWHLTLLAAEHTKFQFYYDMVCICNNKEITVYSNLDVIPMNRVQPN